MAASLPIIHAADPGRAIRAEVNLSEVDIKKAVKNWKADTYRV
jgi:hypothetical protein